MRSCRAWALEMGGGRVGWVESTLGCRWGLRSREGCSQSKIKVDGAGSGEGLCWPRVDDLLCLRISPHPPPPREPPPSVQQALLCLTHTPGRKRAQNAVRCSRAAAPWGWRESPVCLWHRLGLKVPGSRTLSSNSCGQSSGACGEPPTPVSPGPPVAVGKACVPPATERDRPHPSLAPTVQALPWQPPGLG